MRGCMHECAHVCACMRGTPTRTPLTRCRKTPCGRRPCAAGWWGCPQNCAPWSRALQTLPPRGAMHAWRRRGQQAKGVDVVGACASSAALQRCCVWATPPSPAGSRSCCRSPMHPCRARRRRRRRRLRPPLLQLPRPFAWKCVVVPESDLRKEICVFLRQRRGIVPCAIGPYLLRLGRSTVGITTR